MVNKKKHLMIVVQLDLMDLEVLTRSAIHLLPKKNIENFIDLIEIIDTKDTKDIKDIKKPSCD